MTEWLQPVLGFVSASLVALIALLFAAMFVFFSASAAIVLGQFLVFVKPLRVTLPALLAAAALVAVASYTLLDENQLAPPLTQLATGLVMWGLLRVREHWPRTVAALGIAVLACLGWMLLTIPFPGLDVPLASGFSLVAVLQAPVVIAVLGLWPLVIAGLLAHRRAKPVEWFISIRYLVAKRRQTFISVITVICVLGVALGVAVISVVLSVMNGFAQVWEGKIIGARAHFVVHSRLGPLEDYGDLRERIVQMPGVVGATPFLQTDAILRSDQGEIQAVVLKGIDRETVADVTSLTKDMVAGSLDALASRERAETPGVILGSELADRFLLRVGDPVILISPLGGPPTPFGPGPLLRRFQVAGIFRANFFQFDESFIYTSITAAQSFMKLENVVSGIEVRTVDPYRSQSIALETVTELGRTYFARDWKTFYPGFFNALKTERVMMFVLLSFIMVVAGFIIIATLIMMIMEKSRDIAILKAMGCADAGIQRVFAIEGFLIGLGGVGLGLAMGLVITWNLDRIQAVVERTVGFDVLPANVYQLQSLPYHIVPGQLGVIVAIAMVLSIGATLLPCWQAARLDPAEALRYE